ncbi:unnamed protein product [Vitrella brassicaformis CCMP3155]|uniref:EGF-like domain-containing protein n=2 Tax=Vitrella brassicaformis TaxID=1169539 RepID=A0A0G4ER48_VITBC|nr:unnamed protein product [Vitrella brassicaformis CCMP3155]|eukprot:CEM00718.1 unnamed protein product [Vitrella brassicaformis CCMP3155]
MHRVVVLFAIAAVAVNGFLVAMAAKRTEDKHASESSGSTRLSLMSDISRAKTMITAASSMTAAALEAINNAQHHVTMFQEASGRKAEAQCTPYRGVVCGSAAPDGTPCGIDSSGHHCFCQGGVCGSMTTSWDFADLEYGPATGLDPIGSGLL